jgi:hypothetical protein
MVRGVAVLAAVVVLALPACEPRPPPGWATGGASLVVAPATWSGDGETIEIVAGGRVFEDGRELFVVDRAGRVYTDDNESVALLTPDGHLLGNDAVHLGRIGITNASPPGGGTAWLSLLPDGSVVRFDAEGERSSGGIWRGCAGPQLRTCTLVTHLVTLRRVAVPPGGGVSFGVGIGIVR